MSVFLTIDENLRAAMKFFGNATGSGEIEELDGAVAMFSGLDYGVFNIALLTRPITNDLETRLAAIARFFRERTMRWSVWMCEDMLDPASRRRERQTLANFGMRAISNPPGMIAERLLPPARPLPAIECVPVSDAKTRKAFTELTSISFDIPYMVAVRMGDGDKSDVRRLKVELAKLGYQLLRARRMANRCVDRSVGDRIGIAGVPQKPLLAVLDEDACVGQLDRFADVNTR